MKEDRKKLSAYIEMIGRLEQLYDQESLLQPIAAGKWSVLDILCHIWLWDKYILEYMLPKIRPGAVVSFPDHHSINSQVDTYTKSCKDPKMLFQKFIDTRIQIIESFEALLDTGITNFYVGKKECSPSYFLDNYIIKHDFHHKNQMEAYLATL